ncbi:DUF2330 domain-containing protein [Plantactinospora sp. DSM 117369]
MRLEFETDAPVYPMRLSATAEGSQPLRLYVLADRRMDTSNPAPKGNAPDLTFAGEVKPDPQYPRLSAALLGPRFLTRYDGKFRPTQITDDIRFTRSATDEPHRAVVIVREYVHSPWPMPAVPLILLGLALVAGAVVVVHRWSART